MTDQQAVECLRAVRIFCDPMQVQAVDRAIAALRERGKNGPSRAPAPTRIWECSRS